MRHPSYDNVSLAVFVAFLALPLFLGFGWLVAYVTGLPSTIIVTITAFMWVGWGARNLEKIAAWFQEADDDPPAPQGGGNTDYRARAERLRKRP